MLLGLKEKSRCFGMYKIGLLMLGIINHTKSQTGNRDD